MKKLTSILFLVPTFIFSATTLNAQGLPETSQNRVPVSVAIAYPFNPNFPTPEPQVIKEGLLAPNEFDVSEHQYLLNQPNTGLIRLLPRESNDWEGYKVEKKLEMRGGGSFFSFHFRAHPYGYGSDLSLERGSISVGFAGADYGMMTDLGVAPLEQIDVSDARVSYLLHYETPVMEPDVRKEALKFYPGLDVEGVRYKKSLESVVGHTYLLRSISHNRSDVLVAFKIARKDDDGSLIIAWKILKEFPIPKLQYPTTNNN